MQGALGAAALAVLAGAALARAHPLSPLAASLGFWLWCGAAARWRGLWLFVLPAALPLASLAPWTGWLAFDEFDLVVLGAIAGGHARLAWDARLAGGAPQTATRCARAGLAPFDGALLVVVTALGVLAFLHGVADAGGWRFDLHQGYEGPLNAWRVFKSLPYALLLAPLAWREFDAAPVRAGRRFVAGMLAGLAVVSLAVLWERAAYPGLFDWSDPYRVTALFWEMHVGGAAIDAHLVLSMPFLAWALADARRPGRWAALALLAVLATHACLATFARGVWGGVAVSLLLLAGVRWWHLNRIGPPASRDEPPPPHWRGRANALLAVVLAAECAAVVVAGTFVRERTAEIEADFGSRLAHWRRGVALLESPSHWLLGIGIGRIPAHYMRAADGHEPSGAVQLVAPGEGHRAVQVSGPAHNAVLGGLYALTQRVEPRADAYRAAIEARAPRDAEVALQVCERHLLYPRHCREARLTVAAGDGRWQRREAELRAAEPRRGERHAPPLGMFSVAVLTPGASVELREIRLAGPDGAPLLANGDFAAGLAHWFPAARSYFLPWHVDSLWLELAIERGLLSPVAFALLAARALRRLWQAAGGGCAGVALPAGAALGSVLLLGVISSVMDMPRVALLAWLLIVVALRRPAAAGRH